MICPQVSDAVWLQVTPTSRAVDRMSGVIATSDVITASDVITTSDVITARDALSRWAYIFLGTLPLGIKRSGTKRSKYERQVPTFNKTLEIHHAHLARCECINSKQVR